MFRVSSALAALICVILAVIFLVSPGQYVATYGVAADTSGLFLGRRTSSLFLGVAVILWMLRNHADPDVQRAVCWGMIVIFGGIAVTGLSAFVTGIAANTILVAAVGELVIVGAFVVSLRRI
jgi:hypothetical protein